MALQPFVGRWPLIQAELLVWGIGLSQGLYLHTEQTEQTHTIQTSMPRVGFEPTITVFDRSEDSSCLRRRGRCDRHIYLYETENPGT
jgi:hypothetical protein